MTVQGLLLLDIFCVSVVLVVGDMIRRRALHLGCGAYLALPAVLLLLGVNFPLIARGIVEPLDALFPGLGLAIPVVFYVFAGLMAMGLQLCRIQSRQLTLARDLAIQRALIDARMGSDSTERARP